MKILGFEKSYRKKPNNLIEEDAFLFENEYVKEFSPIYIDNIKNYKVLNSGYLFSGFLLYKKFLGYKPSFKLIVKIYLYFFKDFFYKKEDVKGFYVTNSLSYNFFHWHLDVLPKLEALNSEGIHDVIFSSFYNKSFYKETLKLYPEMNFFFLNGCRKLPELNFFPDTAPTGNYRPLLISKLHSRIIKKNKREISETLQKIYISRKKAKVRKILNEDEVLEGIKLLGFKILYMEDLSYDEQVSYMSKADTILSLHGAGLTHMLYMKPGSRVIEIRAEGDSSNNCYYSLASDLMHEYYYLKAKPALLSKSTQGNDFILGDGFIEELKAVVER